ncbi:MAG: PilZ domain-containing protein [Proteobacteria bacterium]|nr:PilZ domain-containing protein [Pseudomonadota bacterium]
MRERRQDFRGRVYYGGRVTFNDRKSTLDCIVRNFTLAGAKIETDEGAILPDEVDIAIERRGVAFLARIVWRREHEAGLVFRNPRHLNATIPLDTALRIRAGERANKMLRLRVEQLSTGY